MAVTRKKLGELLVERGLISYDQLQQALMEQGKTKQKLGDLLISKGIISEQQLIEVLEFQLGIPHITLYKYQIDREISQIIPESMARRHLAIPIQKRGDSLVVAMADPLDYFAIDELRIRTGYQIEPAISSKDELLRMIARHYGMQDTMSEMMENLSSQEEIRETEITDEDSPVVRLVNQMIGQAVQLRASDIHVDPREREVFIRYRIDGVLRNERSLPKKMQGFITARLKIMAKLNIAERRLPQDGRIKLTIDFKQIDIRVSTLPTIHGEKIVLRILDLTNSIKPIDKLGFTLHNEQLFRQMLEHPFGILLITGPTGSGKTTTLYSALDHLNQESTNIITVEDPVEYQLHGINQVQINPVIGLTFAAGLRSILRQDPNVVMVGEIRDSETAEIAIRASLTGHLVLSTIHTNDSISTITRFRDMGIESYLIASSLVGVIAQRLVRKICSECRTQYEATEQEKILLAGNGFETTKLYRGAGCGNCNNTGYRGRIAIHEVLYVTEGMRLQISQDSTIQELRELAEKQGLVQLLADGLQKAVEGFTTVQEVLRETVVHK